MIQPFLKPQEPPQRKILTVSQLNRQAKTTLESSLGSIWLTGEISNLIMAASGHWYFSLKDDSAQIRCAMFRFKTQNLRFSPKNGDKVVVKGKVSLYEPRGDYQLIADYMEASGQGNLQQRLNALIEKLRLEGLFAEENKQPLPTFPEKIGVITSPSGAAIHDVLSVLKRRSPMTPVIIYPVQVQGDKAAQEIIKTIDTAESRNDCDVLLITRGGGSLEDLWCFNDEKLAHRIAACQIPLVAATGHEVDTTITELVADLRAPTPSAAAELLVPEQNMLRQQVDRLTITLTDSLTNKINQLQNQLNITRLKLIDPANTITASRLQLEKINHQLISSINGSCNKKRNRLATLNYRLAQLNPVNQLHQQQQKLTELKQRLNGNLKNRMAQWQHQLQICAGSLQTLSPLSTLSRGYAIVREQESKQVVSHISKLHQGQKISLLLEGGEANCIVEEIQPDKS